MFGCFEAFASGRVWLMAMVVRVCILALFNKLRTTRTQSMLDWSSLLLVGEGCDLPASCVDAALFGVEGAVFTPKNPTSFPLIVLELRIGSSMCGRRHGVSISPSISPSQECANPQSAAPLPGHFSRFRGQRAARSTRGPDLRRPPTSSRTPPCPFLGRRSSCRRQLWRMERQLHRAKHLLDG